MAWWEGASPLGDGLRTDSAAHYRSHRCMHRQTVYLWGGFNRLTEKSLAKSNVVGNRTSWGLSHEAAFSFKHNAIVHSLVRSVLSWASLTILRQDRPGVPPIRWDRTRSGSFRCRLAHRIKLVDLQWCRHPLVYSTRKFCGCIREGCWNCCLMF